MRGFACEDEDCEGCAGWGCGVGVSGTAGGGTDFADFEDFEDFELVDAEAEDEPDLAEDLDDVFFVAEGVGSSNGLPVRPPFPTT